MAKKKQPKPTSQAWIKATYFKIKQYFRSKLCLLKKALCAQDKPGLRQPERTQNLIFFLVILALFLFSGSFLVFGEKKDDDTPKASASPISHLIASISAQREPIKIDPEFSYQEKKDIKKEPPVRVIIPSVNIDAEVIEASIVDGYWQTATDSASFGLGSSYPQESGNTVIFAHARPGLFENLRLIKKEMPVYLMTEKDWFAYKVLEVKNVLPNQIEVVSPTKDKTLTLYTCSGYRDTYRLVVIAKPIDY